MIWYIAAALLFLMALFILVWRFIRDRNYLRKKTSEAIGQDLWGEIQEEREDSRRRKDAFRSALNDAEKKPPS